MAAGDVFEKSNIIYQLEKENLLNRIFNKNNKKMKSEKKLQQAVEILQKVDDLMVRKAIDYIVDFMIDNTRQKSVGLSVRNFVREDIYRPVLGLVFHDNKRMTAVATDANALFTNESEYIPTDGNGLRDVLGNPRPDAGKYVDYFGIIPNETIPTTIVPNLKEIYKKAVAEARLNGVRDKYKIFVLINGETWVNARYVEFMIQAGLDGWELANMGVRHAPLVKKWEGKELLLMPSFIDVNKNEIDRKYAYIK